MLSRLIAGLKRALPFARFKEDARGNIATVFAFSIVAITIAAGGAVDLGRAYNAQQKLNAVATLACQYASRNALLATDATSYTGSNTYASKVASFITTNLQSQNFQYTQTTATPFTSTQNGPANVSLTANVPTTFMQIAQITQMPVSASVHCYDTPSSVTASATSGSYLVQETFGTSGCTGACWWYYPAPGSTTNTGNGKTLTTPNSTPTSTIGYTGTTGTQWVVMGYCVEIDTVGILWPTVPVGTHSAELDCENGSGTAGNSSISTEQYLPAGNYEVRWFYNSRVNYPDYNPAYICGSAASDLSWANDTNSSGGPVPGALRDNQINVYLDLNTTGVPPTHKTIDGTQSLGGSNLVDMCVYTANQNWIERSIRIDITTAGWYWLSFAADGQNDSYGGSIADLRLCAGTCVNTVQDNFPSAWLTSTNLFEDTFESPTYSYSTTGSSAYVNANGNMNNSVGTSGASNDGWPNLAASGWAAAPYNQIDYVMKSAAQGSQAVEVDGTKSGSMTTSNRLISRGFLLDPGYYQVSYDYISDGQFSSLSGVYCGATPSAANVASLTGTATAKSRPTGVSATENLNSNIVGLFMSHALEASTPIGGGALNSTTSYTNPDGTTSTTPTVAPNGISLTSYNSSQVNPLLDICGYATTWQARTASILITKPAYYWLTASALGAPAATYGGTIDDVKLTALGSPYMTSPPASYVTIPAPSPTHDTLTSYTGFSIVADPMTPPAAEQ
ncbi:TadE/TadG family type IV pilus assembly protein [Methylocapsa sp. S129]|uniref:TadE/TadG family type IV pilus assembly protein n=1 Tax=Methylocapsa sp. S129 TaxID=1641869 RepID=UPI00131BBA14|nr:pilus assembly protein TadG-related protein [Methylocapsa sp. S129]